MKKVIILSLVLLLIGSLSAYAGNGDPVKDQKQEQSQEQAKKGNCNVAADQTKEQSQDGSGSGPIQSQKMVKDGDCKTA
ncbi:MAG: hypothetical protein JW969_12320 [Spirochaetales bacterium]|nr:hypothetical protein [Spirochaetales bacterium]